MSRGSKARVMFRASPYSVSSTGICGSGTGEFFFSFESAGAAVSRGSGLLRTDVRPVSNACWSNISRALPSAGVCPAGITTTRSDTCIGVSKPASST